MRVLEVNEEETQWYRDNRSDCPDTVRSVAQKVHKKKTCVCCVAEPDGVCEAGHLLCEHCAEYHGCIACGLSS